MQKRGKQNFMHCIYTYMRIYILKEGPFDGCCCCCLNRLVLFLFSWWTKCFENTNTHTSVLRAEQSTSVYLSIWEFSSFSRWFGTTIAHVFVAVAHIWACMRARESHIVALFWVCSWFHGQSSLNSQIITSTYGRWRHGTLRCIVQAWS